MNQNIDWAGLITDQVSRVNQATARRVEESEIAKAVRENTQKYPVLCCLTCGEELFRRYPYTGMPSSVARECRCERT